MRLTKKKIRDIDSLLLPSMPQNVSGLLHLYQEKFTRETDREAQRYLYYWLYSKDESILKAVRAECEMTFKEKKTVEVFIE
jgi:hypothetical protein